MNIIEFKLCEEDRTRLDRIIDLLQWQASQKQNELDDALIDKTGVLNDHPAGESIAHLEPSVAATTPPTTEPTPVESAPAPNPEVKTISKGEFQKAIVTRCAESPVMKAKVQALVHRYAASVSAIPEDKRSEVLAELANL